MYMPVSPTPQQNLDLYPDGKIKLEEATDESQDPGTFVYADPLQIKAGQVNVEQKDLDTGTQESKLCSACLRYGDATAVRAVRGAALRTYVALCRARGGAGLCAPCRRLLDVAHAFAAQATRAQSILRKYSHGELETDKTLQDLRASLNPLSKMTIVHNVVENNNYFTMRHGADDDGPEVVKCVPEVVKIEPEATVKLPESYLLAIDTKVEPWFDDVADNDDDFNDDFSTASKSENENLKTEKKLTTTPQTKKSVPKIKITQKRKIHDENAQSKNGKRKKLSESDHSPKVTDIAKLKNKSTSKKQGKTEKNKSADNINLKKYMNITCLTLAEQIDVLVQKKESYAYQNAKFKCDVCFRTFRVKSGYESHMFRHTDKFGKHSCAVCHLHFKLKHKLRAHLNDHIYKFNCKQCQFKSHFRNASISHIATHQGKQYTCKVCFENFDHNSTYLGHMRRQHPASHPCQLCGNAFISENGLRLHKRMVHRLDDGHVPENGPLCTQCNTTFVDEPAFRKHMKVTSCAIKEQKRPFRRRVKSEKRLIKCELCTKEFTNYPEFHQHYTREHPDETNIPKLKRLPNVLCDQCGRVFSCASILEDHMSVHAEGSKKSHKCEMCGRCYVTRVSLKLHQYTHSGLRWPCEICGKEFSKQNNRDRHLVYAHTAGKNEKCEICDKGFKTKDRKNAHMAHVHLNRPYPKRDRKLERERRQKQMKEE